MTDFETVPVGTTSELERVNRERDVLAAHVERLREAALTEKRGTKQDYQKAFQRERQKLDNGHDSAVCAEIERDELAHNETFKGDKMRIGDIVRVNNVDSDMYGRIGYVDGYKHRGGLIRVQVGGQGVTTYRAKDLQLVKKKTAKSDEYHVAIITCVDGEIDMDFSNNPSIETMEDEFDLACESEVVIGFLDDIKEEIMDSLESWDNVVGLIDNKPFKASHSLVFEGVDL